jgi:RNA polymerase sigma-70 factor (sigma-E family)
VSAASTFDAFYRRERDPLYRALALTLADADLAAEAVDEAMVRAYQRWARVTDYDNPAGWVYRVALNWALSRLRRRWRSVVVAAVPDRAAADEPDRDVGVLAAAVAALSPRQRAVVVLRFHLDWSVDQIAAALGVPAGTVKSRLHRALAALRESLGDDDGS